LLRFVKTVSTHSWWFQFNWWTNGST